MPKNKSATREKQSTTFNNLFFFILIVVAAAIGGITWLFKKDHQPPEKAEWNNDKYPVDKNEIDVDSPLQFSLTPPLSLVTQIQNRQIVEVNARNNFTVSLSYTDIYQLLHYPEIFVVENGPEGRQSPGKTKEKGEEFKKAVAASLADSSKLNQAFAVRCLQDSAVKLKIFEKEPEVSPLAPPSWGKLFAGGLFQCNDATVYFFKEHNLPYIIAPHELVHCGAAAMGIAEQNLPYSHKLFRKTYPCNVGNMMEEAEIQLDNTLLKYAYILEMEDKNILNSAVSDVGLHQLLKAADHFNPLYQTLMRTTDFSSLKNQYRLRRGTVIPDKSFIRNYWNQFLPVGMKALPEEFHQLIYSYRQTAFKSPFKIFNIMETMVETVVIVGTPTKLSSVDRARALILRVIAAKNYAAEFELPVRCPELFAELVSGFPDEVLQILLPDFYATSLQGVTQYERGSAVSIRSREGDRDDWIEDNTINFRH